MNEHYIDRRFREELDGLEANPPVEAWLAISDMLDLKRKKLRKLVFFRTAATIALLLFASFSLWFTVFNETTPGNELQFAQTIPNTLQPVSLTYVTAVEVPVERINPKNIDHHLSLYRTTRDNGHDVHSENKTFIATMPALETQSLATSRPVDLTTTKSSTHIINNKQYNKQSRQTASLTSQRNSKTTISLGAHMGPQYNYRYLANSSLTEFPDVPFQSLENQIYTYSTGLSAFVRLSSRWTLQTGLNYNNTGQFIDGIASYHHPENISLYNDNQFVITSLGGVRIYDAYHHFEDIQSYRVLSTRQTLDHSDVTQLNKTTDGITQTFSYIEIPLLVRYNVHRQNIEFDVKGGVAGNYLLRKDVYLGTDIFQNPIGETYGIKQFNFSVIGGVALNVPITGNFMLHIEPTAQLFLQPVVLEGLRLGNAVPYNFSLQTGFSYRF